MSSTQQKITRRCFHFVETYSYLFLPENLRKFGHAFPENRRYSSIQPTCKNFYYISCETIMSGQLSNLLQNCKWPLSCLLKIMLQTSKEAERGTRSLGFIVKIYQELSTSWKLKLIHNSILVQRASIAFRNITHKAVIKRLQLANSSWFFTGIISEMKEYGMSTKFFILQNNFVGLRQTLFPSSDHHSYLPNIHIFNPVLNQLEALQTNPGLDWLL